MKMRALRASHPRVHTLSNLHVVSGHRAVCHAVRVGGGAGTSSVGGLPKVQTELSHGTSGSGTATSSTPSENSHPIPGNFLPQPPPSAYATLLFVTMLWGSYNPTIRFLYDSDHALAPATLTGIRTAIAASALAIAIVVDKVKAQPGQNEDKQKQQPVVPRSTSPDAPLLSRTFSTVVPAGIELGLYNFLGTSLQAMGLQMTTATRAGFLVQLTAVLVPVLSALAGVPISSRVWVAATLALAGTVLIATDGTSDQPPEPSTTTPSTPSTTIAPASEVASSSTASAQAPVDQMTSAAILQDGQSITSMSSAGTVAGTSASIPVHDVTAVATALGGPDRLGDAVVSSKLLPAAVAAATPAVESGSLENSSMLAATTGAVADAAVSAAIATVAVASNTVTATVDALVDAASATSPAVEGTVNAVSTVAGTVADVAVSAAFGASGAVEGTVASVSSAAGTLVDAATAAAPMVAIGDLYLIAACFSYSLATVRLGFYAPMFSTVELTAVKKFTLGTASAIWLASAIDFQGFNESISQQTPFDWTLVAYSALGPGALATFLQTKGQVSVPPTLAQVVYSLTPVWSAILAFVILGDVGMGPVAWVGSGAILVASGIATSGGSPQEKPAAADAGRPSPVVGQDEPEVADSVKPQSASVDGSSDGVEVYAAASTSMNRKSPEDVAVRVKE